MEGAVMTEDCVFCQIVRGASPASVVHEDELTVAFLDLHQFHPGHTLLIPREHLADVREVSAATGAALMVALARLTRAVGEAFPSEGISVWHSIGPAAFQEVPHLHFHIQPRTTDDGLLRVYPSRPAAPDRAALDRYAASIREHL
jgi:histidine triad (HIT) family protein